MRDYQHNLAVGRIVNTNPLAADTIDGIENFISFLPDNGDDVRKAVLTKRGTDEDGNEFFEFSIDVHGDGELWDFDMLVDLLDDSFEGVMLDHPNTYAIVLMDSRVFPQIVPYIYGSVKEKNLPYSRETLAGIFGEEDCAFSLDTVHPLIAYMMLPIIEWNRIFKISDIIEKIQKTEHQKIDKTTVDYLIKELSEFLGPALCTEGINPNTAVKPLTFIPADNSKNAILCFCTADSMTTDPELLLQAQRHANQVLEPLGGTMRYLFSGGAGELMSDTEHMNTPVIVRYVRNKEGMLVSAEINAFEHSSD